MDKWQCNVCGYVYNPDVGEPDRGTPPGSNFEDFPDDWICPICGIDKEMFHKIEVE